MGFPFFFCNRTSFCLPPVFILADWVWVAIKESKYPSPVGQEAKLKKHDLICQTSSISWLPVSAVWVRWFVFWKCWVFCYAPFSMQQDRPTLATAHHEWMFPHRGRPKRFVPILLQDEFERGNACRHWAGHPNHRSNFLMQKLCLRQRVLKLRFFFFFPPPARPHICMTADVSEPCWVMSECVQIQICASPPMFP